MCVFYRPASQQGDPKWLYVYAILVASVIAISLARALAFFESTFRWEPLSSTQNLPNQSTISLVQH